MIKFYCDSCEKPITRDNQFKECSTIEIKGKGKNPTHVIKFGVTDDFTEFSCLCNQCVYEALSRKLNPPMSGY